MNPELKWTKFLLWTLLVLSSPHPGLTQAEELAALNVKMTNIMERMARLEDEMETKNEIMASMKESIDIRDLRIVDLEDGLGAKEVEMCELKEKMERTDLKLMEMVDQVRNPLFAFQCAWQDGWNADNSIITYDRLSYNDMSGGGIIHNVTGGLDIVTGVFTVGHGFSGVWTVSYSIASVSTSESANQVWIYLNGEKIEESRHLTYITAWTVQSLGARTLYMRLEEGDTVTLRTEAVLSLHDVTLCFQLAQYDTFP